MPEEQPRSTGFKVLIGCAVLAGVGAIAFVALIAISAWWILNPGEQLDAMSITSPNTIALVHATDLSADPNVRAYLDESATYLMEKSRALQTSQIPEDMQWVRSLQSTNSLASAEAWSRLIPTDFAYVVEETEAGESTRIAINFRSLVRLFAAVLTSDPEGHRTADGELTEHQGRTLIRMDSEHYITFEGGTVLGSESVERLSQVIDNVIDDSSEDSPLDAELTLIHAEWPLAGISRDSRILAKLLGPDMTMDEMGVIDPTVRTIDRLWFGLRFDDADTIALRLAMDGVADEMTELWSSLLTEYSCPMIEENFRELALEPTCTVNQSGWDFTLDIRATGARAATRAAIDSSFQQ